MSGHRLHISAGSKTKVVSQQSNSHFIIITYEIYTYHMHNHCKDHENRFNVTCRRITQLNSFTIHSNQFPVEPQTLRRICRTLLTNNNSVQHTMHRNVLTNRNK